MAQVPGATLGMTVRRVEVDDRRARFRRSGGELVITPRRPLDAGRAFEIEVRYDGVPTEFPLVVGPDFSIRSGFMATEDGAIVAGEPQVASGWFPVNDHPLDKASFTFDVTVPRGREVVANGVLRTVERNGSTTTYEWHAREPMAPYLATIDIGLWDVRKWSTDDGLPVYDAVDSAITGGLREQIDASLARQDEVLDVLSAAFGPYPFSTVGGIVDDEDELLFALETQTRPVYSKGFWLGPEDQPVNGDAVVVHELAHQWFGDDVALARWRDIWLNEGFATYAEWLWAEHVGQGTTAETLRATYAAIPADDPFWTLAIGDPDSERLFDGAVYVRGAMTLQALREEVGDATFFAIVRGWAATRSGGNATTEEFIAFAERLAGRSLAELFDTWLYTPERPALEGAQTGDAAAGARMLAEAEEHHGRAHAHRR